MTKNVGFDVHDCLNEFPGSYTIAAISKFQFCSPDVLGSLKFYLILNVHVNFLYNRRGFKHSTINVAILSCSLQLDDGN